MAGERSMPGLGLAAYWTTGSDGWDVLMNTNLGQLSAIVHLTVLSRVAALPGSPVDGQIYLLTATADVNKIAVRDNGAWTLYTPKEGWLCYVADEDVRYTFDGTSWTGVVIINSPTDPLQVISDGGTAGLGFFVKYVTNPNVGAFFVLRHANGSFAAPSDSLAGDRMGILAIAGRAGGAFRNVCGIEGRVGTGTISASSLPSYLAFLTSPDGSIARTERMRLDQDGNMQMGGLNTVIDFNRLFRLRVYTVATLPAAGTRGRVACVSDATAPTFLGALTGGGAVSTPVFDNGSAWVSY